MTIDCYYMPASGPCRAVLMVAKELGVYLDLKNVNLMAGEQHTEKYNKINPLHLVPAIVDNGFRLAESRAIMTYLVNKYAPGHDLYPSDPQTRALVDCLLYMDATVLTPASRDIYKPTLFTHEPVKDETRQLFADKLTLIDTLLAGKHYFVGDKATLADISIFATLTFMRILDYDFTPYPNVTGWMARLGGQLPYNKEVNDVPIEQLKAALNPKK